jgi:hypothetical protein
MPMYRYAILCLAILALALPAHARLGESMEQLTARFGKASEANEVNDIRDMVAREKRYKFSKEGIQVVAGLIDGRCEYIKYYKYNAFIKEEEVQALLKANGRNLPWIRLDDPKQNPNPAPKPPGVIERRRSDKLVYAFSGNSFVTFITLDYARLSEEQGKADAKQKAQEEKAKKAPLEGF